MGQLSFLQQEQAVSGGSLAGCSLIYEPRGRAREYAALACNIYSGCDHQCSYCYAPDATHKTRNDFCSSRVRPNFVTALLKESAKYKAAGVREQVLLCFTCDPYQHLDKTLMLTRRTIEILHRAGLSVCALTKGGTRAIRDLDLFTPRDAFASTLTFLDEARSQEWEPGAALPNDRIKALCMFHQAGIPTWVSLEPTIDPAASLEIIRHTHGFVDLFKVGKLNYHAAANGIDWRQYALDAVALLQSLGYRRNLDSDAVRHTDSSNRQFYVKKDLAHFLELA